VKLYMAFPNYLIPRRKVVPKKKKFLVFYETLGFIIAFTTARHLSVSRARSVQFIYPILLVKDLF